RRQAALGRLTPDSTIPLGQLLQMNAADVAGSGEWSERYYGQCWALARLLTTDPMFKDGFARLVAVCATERVESLAEPAAGPTAYHPAAVQPLLEQYVTPRWWRLEFAYAESLSVSSRSH